MARKMKDSGVVWIAAIPEQWKIIKFKNLVKYTNAGEVIDKTYWNAGNELLYTCQKTPMLSDYVGFPEEKRTQQGEILLTRNASPYIFIPEEGSIYSNVVQRVKLKNGYNVRYIRYALLQGAESLMVNGNTIPSYNMEVWKNIYIPWVEEETQENIANFLDYECSRIDSVIKQTRTSIEEYKKLKQAVITQAVTKSIRPGRAMKDSGIKGIGEVPEDWEITRFKYIANVKSNLVSPDDYADYPQVSPENIEKGTGNLLQCKTVSEVGVISGNHLFYKGQILYSKIRPKLNKITIAPFDGLCSADMYPIETNEDPKFLLYAMLSDVLLDQVSMITEDRVKMPKINQEELGNTWFVKPPQDEQKKIVDYLDEKTNEIDALILAKEQLYSALESYKKSLIYEYVTGKKEVPACQ